MVGRFWMGVLFLLLLLGQMLDRSSEAQRLAVPAGAAVTMPVDSSVGAALRSLGSRAGVVFVGQVQRIRREGGVVEITFSVQQAVLGDAGSTYTLREWGGLWTGGRQRYRVGERAMLFLHAVNGAGISSPVDGMDGVVPLVPMGADAEPLLDVRRLATRVLRRTGQPMAGEAVGLTAAALTVRGEKQGVVVEPEHLRLPQGLVPAGALDARR